MKLSKADVIFAVLLGMTFAFINFAHAEPVCTERTVIVEKLKKDYGEEQVYLRVASDKTTLEIWSNEDTQTFSIVSTATNGFSCVIAAGQGPVVYDYTEPVGGYPKTQEEIRDEKNNDI